jgi:hypothetical protein
MDWRAVCLCFATALLVLDLPVSVKCAVTTGIDDLPNPAFCAKLKEWQRQRKLLDA